MGVEMAAKLYDADGRLKSFAKWADDVRSISSHQVGSWLQTEYDTAVIRAHTAADWREFERNKDILPNLRWMPTTSKEPESSHREYWVKKLTLPVDDPFWNEHHPGDRWNCKCSLEATDDPVVRPDDMEPTKPQRGLENNPGKDGHTFSQEHPYFPKGCSSCPFNKGFKNKMGTFFRNGKKHCYNCGKIDQKLKSVTNKADIFSELQQLMQLQGKEFGTQLKAIIKHKEFKPIKGCRNIYSVGGEKSEDYQNLINAAKKAVKHGYIVYILPNPNGVKTADFIFVRKGVCKLFDLKTIIGGNSAGNRLMESIGQTNRVLLNMATQYNPRALAQDIKDYFEVNKKAKEVLIFKGNTYISITRKAVEKNFEKFFVKMYYKKK